MKTSLIYILLFIVNAFSFAQVSEDDSNFVMLTTDYATNTSVFGVILPDKKQPNLISTISYSSKHKFDITYINVLTANSDSSFSRATFENDFMFGYSFILSEDLILYPNYTRLFSSSNSYSLTSLYKHIFQTDLMLFKKNYNGSVSVGYMVGDKNMFNLALHNSLEVTFKNVLIKKSSLNIQLGFIINLSDKNYYNKAIYDSWDRANFLQYVYDNSPEEFLKIARSILNNGFVSAKTRYYDSIIQNNKGLFDSDYGISSIDLYLPVYYSIGNFSLNFTAYINNPLFITDFYKSETSLLYSIGASYYFMIK